MDNHIAHISEKDFETVCKKLVSKNPMLHYQPADWHWSAYPDIGYATISNGNGIYVTWGHNKYKHLSAYDIQSEECICVTTPNNGLGEYYIIDTKKQCLELIKKSFGIDKKSTR